MIQWLIEAGHGGIDANGKYTTSEHWGKKYKFPDGLCIYEGVTNRAISLKLMKLLDGIIPFTQIHDDILDLTLTERVKRVNNRAWTSKNKCILLDIHSNAGNSPEKIAEGKIARGFEVFTSPGPTKSDEFAEIFYEELIKGVPEFPFRADMSDGDHDKEERFTMLTKTKCPAITLELLFFDEREQANFLLSEEGQRQLATCLFKGIKRINALMDFGPLQTTLEKQEYKDENKL